jgi:hypothetical protein
MTAQEVKDERMDKSTLPVLTRLGQALLMRHTRGSVSPELVEGWETGSNHLPTPQEITPVDLTALPTVCRVYELGNVYFGIEPDRGARTLAYRVRHEQVPGPHRDAQPPTPFVTTVEIVGRYVLGITAYGSYRLALYASPEKAPGTKHIKLPKVTELLQQGAGEALPTLNYAVKLTDEVGHTEAAGVAHPKGKRGKRDKENAVPLSPPPPAQLL